jgi:D-alanyl-D-alanine carboxypeptidase/D-alanyl-D-alanine-endopeptidase (penicillin-binding protein 4)
MTLRTLSFLSLLALLAACSAPRQIRREVAHSTIFGRGFTGFTLLDPATGKTLADFNGDHYFTPASNTKILTLATCLEVLGDSVPTFRYQRDSILCFSGTGDPTFLHPQFQAWQRGFSFLKENEALALFFVPNRDGWQRFGPGWAWDDVDDDYSAEISDLPIYANLRRVFARDSSHLAVEPPFFGGKNFLADDFLPPSAPLHIERSSNLISFRPAHRWEKNFERWVPIRWGDISARAVLADTLQRRVIQFAEPRNYRMPHQDLPKKTFYSTPLDTVLRRMMHQSDNFIAEQMLLVCASEKLGVLRQDTMIQWMLDSTWRALPQPPKWVDGSGLSRYNLASPRSLAQVLWRLWRTQPKERLFDLFPAGGVSGTVAGWYAGPSGQPYVFAKTGTLGGVHCLSGYIVCRSGKVLIFSFMHNNFVGSSRAWKAEMQRVLERIAAAF